MDFFCRVSQLVFLLLFNCKFCGCYGIVCAGKLTVDSDIILFGSNLTVHCKSSIERCGRRFAIDFNGQTIFETTSCSTIQTQIAVKRTTFSVLCKVKQDDKWHIVCGQDFKAGYPPGKVKFNCVTHRHSEYVNCLLTATNVTYLNTNYTVTFKNNKTSQFLKYEMPKDGHVSILRSVFDETLTYQIHVRGRNALGESNSTFTFSVWDSVLPSTPEIAKITFENGSLSPTIHCKSSEDSLKPSLRFRRAHDMQDWVMGNITELHVGTLLMQEALKPMMSYQFELRMCVTSVNCSMWSHPYNATSPGIAPSHKLDVWRVIKDADSHGFHNVTVFWKPYTSEDYSGNLLEYKLSYKEDGKVHEVMCSAHAINHTLQLPLGVAKVNVSAVTSAGSSPPAHVSLIYTGNPAPIITYLTPAAEGSMYLAWDLPYYGEAVKGVLGFVVQWQQSPVHLQWKRLGKDYNSTFLKGLKAGVLYNISLYIEEANGVSNPAFCQVYAKEERPLTGPDASITTVGEKIILIQWEQLDQEKQRGFITNYTIYIQRHRDKRLLENKTVPYIFPRSFNWELMGPQESFDVLISAWNSAGEGPKGKAVTCYCQKSLMCGDIAKTYQLLPDRMTAGMVAGLAAAVPMVILANLMYLKCVRQRMMKMCMSMGVTWLFEILPKFDNSNAIKLLKDDSYSPWGHLTEDNDPPLTPIVEVSLSWERQDSYPTVLHEDVTETPVVGQICIDCPYKPQLLNTSLQIGEETTEEEVKEDEEDQFPLLVSPSHVLHDFSLDFTSIPAIHGHLNSFLAMDGTLRSLNVLGDLLSNPLAVSDKEEEETRMETMGDVEQTSFTSQSILPNDLLESCLRGPVFNSIPYSPQGVCHSFPMPEEV